MRPSDTWSVVLRAMADIAPVSGESADDEELLPSFLPTPSFLRALDPNILLVLGERGAGKTALFRVLAANGLDALTAMVPGRVEGRRSVLTLGEHQWLAQAAMERLLAGASPATTQLFWLVLLVQELVSREFLADTAPGVREVVAASRFADRIEAAEANTEDLFSAIDALDARLRRENHQISVCYDQLDAMMPTLPGAYSPIGALFALWFSQRRRWLHIRPKIFLRVDLFEASQTAFPDGSKFFAGHQTELVWDRIHAWRMWVKRMVNRGPAERRLVVQRWMNRVSPKLIFDELDGLGLVPKERPLDLQMFLFEAVLASERRSAGESVLAPLMYDLVGRYMGSGPRKGDSFSWVSDHAEDANGRLLPRSFLHILRNAAESAMERGPVDDDDRPPLRPGDIVRGLEFASSVRLRDLLDEDPWIDQVVPSLTGLEVPAPAAEWIARLDTVRWKARDNHGGLRATLPEDTPPETVLALLCRRGVVQERSGGTFTVPDIYRSALRVKRRGGPSRRVLD